MKSALFALTLALPICGLAEYGDQDAPFEQRQLLNLLQAQTEIATHNRMNADYVPGMATVLYGDELLLRGVRTVWEALSWVPGISVGMEATGERQVLSRGVGHDYASGNIKLMLDHVSLNSALTAQADPLLNMPIEQVERIEVIRGPGSSIHGEYAYAGVVDVITRHQGRRLYAQIAADHTYGGGAIWRMESPERRFALSVNLAGYDGDGADMPVIRDALFQSGEPILSNTPGPANEDRRYRGLVTTMEWEGWSAAFRHLESAFGDHFGINHFLPPAEDRLVTTHRYDTVEIERPFTLGETLSGHARIEGLRHEQQRDRLYVAPAGYWGNDEPIYMDRDYHEHRWLGELELDWRPDPAHQLLFGLEASRTWTDEASWRWYGFPYEMPSTWLGDLDRSILGLVIQDQYQVTSDLTITGTLRHDHYSDVGDLTSPRLAAVWRLSKEHLIKLQYARAFRPPTFYELSYPASGELDPSEISTWELGYILRLPTTQWRLTLFDSRLQNPIHFDGWSGYENAGDLHLRGAELEFQQRLAATVKLDSNLSFVDTRQSDGSGRLPGGARWLANAALMWLPSADWSLALQACYVGERARAEYDRRDPLGDHLTLDVSLGYHPGPAGLTLRGGIKNITDEEIRYPEGMIIDSDGQNFLPYPDDYPRPGRQWWLSLSLDF